MADDPGRHGLRAGFDLAAEDYQRTRPVCPLRLFDDLMTQSSTRALGEARSAEFLARVRHRLESDGWHRLTATFVGYLTVGRRMEPVRSKETLLGRHGTDSGHRPGSPSRWSTRAPGPPPSAEAAGNTRAVGGYCDSAADQTMAIPCG